MGTWIFPLDRLKRGPARVAQLASRARSGIAVLEFDQILDPERFRQFRPTLYAIGPEGRATTDQGDRGDPEICMSEDEALLPKLLKCKYCLQLLQVACNEPPVPCRHPARVLACTV